MRTLTLLRILPALLLTAKGRGILVPDAGDDATPKAATNRARINRMGPVPRADRSWVVVESSDTSAPLSQGQAVAATIRASILAQNPLMTKY
jgi:hypothetical protein